MEIGLGWIGWTEDVTLDTSMHGIQAGYEGRTKMLKAIFGDGKSSESVADASRPMTPELFDSIFP